MLRQSALEKFCVYDLLDRTVWCLIQVTENDTSTQIILLNKTIKVHFNFQKKNLLVIMNVPFNFPLVLL